MGRKFLETEVWFILYTLVKAGKNFELLKKKIGNINPRNILVNENGFIRIYSSISLAGELNNYEEFLGSNKNEYIDVYLAPEEINHDLITKGIYPS